jgi:rhodanese-related sulfurtransferase
VSNSRDGNETRNCSKLPERWQHDGEELALIDVRRQVDFGEQHLLYATCIPLSRMEVMAQDLLPCPCTRIVLMDDGFSSQPPLAEKAAEILKAIGYMDVAVLEGGVRAWGDAGLELYSGINVPSKAFGEFVLDRCHTPLMSAAELFAKVERQENLVIIDVRPWQEYVTGTIPGAQNVPGAEIGYRLHDFAPNPATEVVVTCGGRTRSIIGTQSLINIGVPHRISALENGTLGWQLAGLNLERPKPRCLQVSSAANLDNARQYAARLVERFPIRKVDRKTLDAWYADRESRTTYVVDVRLREEYAAGHLQYAQNVPGGQLIQTTDEHLAVRNGRVVLVDDTEVRATVTASWLHQMGWTDVHVLRGGIGPAELVQGMRQPAAIGMERPLCHENDVWQDACEREDATDEDLQAYIDWEVALLDQLKQEGEIDFRF